MTCPHCQHEHRASPTKCCEQTRPGVLCRCNGQPKTRRAKHDAESCLARVNEMLGPVGPLDSVLARARETDAALSVVSAQDDWIRHARAALADRCAGWDVEQLLRDAPVEKARSILAELRPTKWPGEK